MDPDTRFDLDDCSASSSVLRSFKDSAEPKGGVCNLYFFLFAE